MQATGLWVRLLIMREIPFWIRNQKINTFEEEIIPPKVNGSNLLSTRQIYFHDNVVKNLNDNKQLLMTVAGQASSCKNLQIDSLRQLLGNPINSRPNPS